ncbi:hypothetical protein F4776DRAFT_648439 [Hypoxylon sp. NC0597]|nr:hypothetical protein F4776DRAFT_648439 [Hypoxylon sp. NC0597]
MLNNSPTAANKLTVHVNIIPPFQVPAPFSKKDPFNFLNPRVNRVVVVVILLNSRSYNSLPVSGTYRIYYHSCRWAEKLDRMETSPIKRRVLAPMDANSRTPKSTSKLEVSETQLLYPTNNATKRPLDQEPVHQAPQCSSVQPAKRQRTSIDGDAGLIAEDQERSLRRDPPNDEDGNGNDRDSATEDQRSESPDEESSIFDNSAIDTSEATMITEPDAEVAAPTPPAPPRRPRAMTREEARIKAETLRLRLGLASYKVRTGQTDVPLDQLLKVRPLLGSGKSRQDEQGEQPSLPRLLRPTSSRNDEEGEQRSRPTTATRKALPSAPPSRQGDSFDQGRSPAGRRSLPELAAASLNTIRGATGGDR